MSRPLLNSAGRTLPVGDVMRLSVRAVQSHSEDKTRQAYYVRLGPKKRTNGINVNVQSLAIWLRGNVTVTRIALRFVAD